MTLFDKKSEFAAFFQFAMYFRNITYFDILLKGIFQFFLTFIYIKIQNVQVLVKFSSQDPTYPEIVRSTYILI